MRFIYIISVILAFAAIMNTGAYGQSPGIIDEFKLSEDNGQVRISWVLTFGKTCLGTKIYKSSDSLNFHLIGSIEGICGSEYSSQSFIFFDKLPVTNKKSFYQLEFGGYGKSEILSITVINTGSSDYLLHPNPLTTAGYLFIDNDNGSLLNLRIFDTRGTQIRQEQSDGEYFTIEPGYFSAGQYYFIITDSNNEIRARSSFQISK